MGKSYRRSIIASLFCVIFTTVGLGQDLVIDQNHNSTHIQSSRKKTISFAPDKRMDLSSEGTIEFWLSHEAEKEDLKDFADEHFTNDAYSVVLAMGTEERLAFAVVLGYGTNGPSSIGVVNDLKLLNDPKAYRKASVNLEFAVKKRVGFPSEMEVLARNGVYHIALTKVKGDDQIKVFINGQPQTTIDATFGKTAESPLRIGWVPRSEDKDAEKDDADNADDEANRPPALYPFDGEIGGVRLWRRELDDVSIAALYNYKGENKLTDLLSLTEYGDLIGYATFSGVIWSREQRDYIKVDNPTFQIADPLAGVWRLRDAGMKESKKKPGVMNDYPIYSFTPSKYNLEGFPSTQMKYLVFEDGNYIGKFFYEKNKRNSVVQEWTFEHVEGSDAAHRDWPKKLAFTAELVVPEGPDGNGRQQWQLKAKLPKTFKGNFSGARGGQEVVLSRPTITDMGLKTFTVNDLEQSEADMTQVFLLGNNIKYRNMLYRSYNFVTMDRINLLNDTSDEDDAASFSASKTKYVIEIPKAQGLFTIDTDTHKITPKAMGFIPKLQGSADTTSTFYSSAREAGRKSIDRLGLGIGINGSIKGSASPFGVGVDVTVGLSLDIGFQSEAIKDMMAMNKSGKSLFITNSIYRHYLIYHKKDRMRLDKNFRTAVHKLAQDVKKEGDSPTGNMAKLEHAFKFYKEWGTHYPLAATFGAMAWWEKEVTEKEVEEKLMQSESFKVSINNKDTGPENGVTDNLKELFSLTKGKARSLGGTSVSNEPGPVSAGDEPVPVEIDLRPIASLLTPQHFPEHPEVFIDLRKNMLRALPLYIRYEQDRAIVQLITSAKAGSLVVNNSESLHRGVKLTLEDIADVDHDLSDIEKRGGEAIGELFGKAREIIGDTLENLTPTPKPRPQAQKLDRLFREASYGYAAAKDWDVMPPVTAPAVEKILTNRTTQRVYNLHPNTPPRNTSFDPYELPRWQGNKAIMESALAFFSFAKGGTSTGKSTVSMAPAPSPRRFVDAAYVRNNRWLGASLTPSKSSFELEFKGDGSLTCHLDFTSSGNGPILVCGKLKIIDRVTDGLEFQWPDRSYMIDYLGGFSLARSRQSWTKLVFSVDLDKQQLRIFIDGRFYEFATDKAKVNNEVKKLDPLQPFASNKWRFSAKDEKGKLKSSEGMIDELIVFDGAKEWAEMSAFFRRSRLTEDEYQNLRGGKLAVLAKVVREAKLPRKDPGIEWQSQQLWNMLAFYIDKDHDGKFSEEEIKALGKAAESVTSRTPEEFLEKYKEDIRKAYEAGTSTPEQSVLNRKNWFIGSLRSRLDKALEDVHEQLDVDKSKGLDESEATQLLAVIEIDGLKFKHLDTNKNGSIDQKESYAVLIEKLDLVKIKKKP